MDGGWDDAGSCLTVDAQGEEAEGRAPTGGVECVTSFETTLSPMSASMSATRVGDGRDGRSARSSSDRAPLRRFTAADRFGVGEDAPLDGPPHGTAADASHADGIAAVGDGGTAVDTSPDGIAADAL